MNKIIEFFKGKKTYIFAALLFLTYGAEGMGWLSPDVAAFLKGFFGAGAIASLRAAIV